MYEITPSSPVLAFMASVFHKWLYDEGHSLSEIDYRNAQPMVELHEEFCADLVHILTACWLPEDQWLVAQGRPPASEDSVNITVAQVPCWLPRTQHIITAEASVPFGRRS